jgi:hypothetical protein
MIFCYDLFFFMKKGTSFDQALIWELFEKTIKAAEILSVTQSEIDEIKTTKNKLCGPHIGLLLFVFYFNLYW